MYNDKLLEKIANCSTAKLWNSGETRKLFTDMAFVLLRNDYGELFKLNDLTSEKKVKSTVSKTWVQSKGKVY